MKTEQLYTIWNLGELFQRRDISQPEPIATIWKAKLMNSSMPIPYINIRTRRELYFMSFSYPEADGLFVRPQHGYPGCRQVRIPFGLFSVVTS